MFKFIKEAQRVMAVARKPEHEQYIKMLKIVTLGIIGIGMMGFIITFLFSLIR